ncbi:uncharacterized protein LOC134787637 [Penaeus indicus]|uniref:uncharacterized protein LOC134787637 n=1 Tax=Penaeus indicus TaxID=29960 RepID=UPI00300CFAF5
MREGSVDVQAFYKRAVQHVWTSLQLQEAEDILKEGDTAMVRQLVAHITKDDIKILKQYLETQNNILQVDEFLTNALVLEKPPLVEPRNVIAFSLEWITSVFEVGKNVEVWLYSLCALFILLAIWAVFLFIRDIQRELRWTRVIGMMIVIIFFICCLWHWRHMHKVAESRRHAQMAKRGYSNIPEECKPGGKSTTGSVWSWVKVSVFGAPDVCEQYFEDLMVDPTQEITPGMVIAETLSKFCFQPLQHLGSESAKFINNFYSNIPVVYHIPATAFFLLLLIIILFAMCGYGIDFPLWMGGIRPIYRTETVDTSELDKIRREMQKDTELLMSEARLMLTDMAKAASSTQGVTQPLLVMSSGIIETKLEHLISQHFSSILSSQEKSANTLAVTSPIQGEASLNNSGIYNVTSTPIGRNPDSKEMDRNTEIKSDNEIKLTRQPQDAKDQTDADHWHLQGARPKDFTPKEKRASNISRLFFDESSSDRQKNVTEKENISLNTSREANVRPASSLSRSLNNSQMFNQSRDYSGLDDNSFETSDEVDNTSARSGSFLDQVKKILEESVNSNANDSIPMTSLNASRSGTRESPEPEEEHEMELSSSNGKFLSQIKRIMTP